MKTVSVIIPTFNRASRIEQTIDTVLNQDYPAIEIIVVDDGSSDSTQAVIRNIYERNSSASKKIRYFHQANQGACVARNRGMMVATGSYIMFLDSDDLLMPTKLSMQVGQIEADNSQCSICDFEYIDAAGNIGRYKDNHRHPHDFIRTLVSPHISTVLMRRDSIPPGLQWNIRLKRIQDMDFVFKYFASIESWSHINQALFRYCIHDGERISDSYTNGIQYSVLRESFKSYLINNESFITTNPGKLFKTYTRALRQHQLKNTLISFIPISARKLLRRYRNTHIESSTT